MAEPKTKPNSQNVRDILNKIEPQQKRDDSLTLLDLFEKITGKDAVMWGDSIVGFDMYHYKSERSAQEGDWPLTGFAPRKQNLTLYVMDGMKDSPLFARLGKHTTSVSCLYINKLADVDMEVLAEIIKTSYDNAKKTHKQEVV